MRTRRRELPPASPIGHVQNGEESAGERVSPAAGSEYSRASSDDNSFNNESEYGDDFVPERARQTRTRQRPSTFLAADSPPIDDKSAPESEIDQEPPTDIYKIPPYPPESRSTRVYTGPLKKWHRFHSLVHVLYGHDQAAVDIVNDLRRHWFDYHVLPRKAREAISNDSDGDDDDDGDDAGGMVPSPWLSDEFEAEQIRSHRRWFEHLYRQPLDSSNLEPIRQQTCVLSAAAGQPYLPPPSGGIVALIGPAAGQKAVRFEPGGCLALQTSGEAAADDGHSRQTAGWMLDVGGTVVAMDWAPLAGPADQLLALAVLPFSDLEYQTSHEDEEEEEANTSRKAGSIQLWSMSLGPTAALSLPLPRLARVLCFDWGRPKRIQWCPVPLVEDTGSVCGLLAVLTSDGLVRVVKVSKAATVAAEATQFVRVDHPVATLGRFDEYNVVVTCLAWLGINRLSLGHSDGSISTWSVDPPRLLQRVPVHTSFVLDIASGYPSHPYMVASYPLGGLARLVDLTRPSAEHTFHPMPVIGFQSGLLRWSDHLQGFASAAPSNNPLSGNLHFMHVRFYARSRPFFPGRGLATRTCLSVGTVHPFVLVGRADGSLWACNMMDKVFAHRYEPTYRLKVLEAEFRPQPGDGPGDVRGAVRILQGFAAERNEIRPTAAATHNPKKQVTVHDNDDDVLPSEGDEGDGDDDDEEEEDDAPDTTRSGGPSPTVIYEPLSRISAVAWNPNIEHGWWAAVAMASGLVRIMDLGVEAVA